MGLGVRQGLSSLLLAFARLPLGRRRPGLRRAAVRLLDLGRTTDVRRLERAVERLCRSDFRAEWLVAAHRLLELAPARHRGELAQRKLARALGHLPFLWTADEAQREAIVTLLDRIGLDRVRPHLVGGRQRRSLAAFLLVAAPPRAAELLSDLRLNAKDRERATTRLLARFEARIVDEADLVRFAERLADPAVAQRIVAAAEPGGKGVARIGRALARAGWVEAAGRLAGPFSDRDAACALLVAQADDVARGLAWDRRAAWFDGWRRHRTPALAAGLSLAEADALQYEAARLTLAAAEAVHPGRASLAAARVGLVERVDGTEEPREGVSGERREAQAAIAAGRLDDAIDRFAKLARDGNAGDAAAHMAALLLAGRIEEGRAAAAKGTERFPGDPRFPLKRAQLAEREGQWSQALHLYRDALALGPKSRVARAAIARVLLMAGATRAAADWIDCCRDPADPLTFWTWPAGALAALRLGDRASAERLQGEAYAIGHAHARAHTAARAEDPRNVYLPGLGSRQHPEPRAARSADLWDGAVARMRAGDVALVGNAPRLNGAGQGSAIDRHGTVMRLNDFRVAGHERDVGARTDLWYSSAARQAEPDRASVSGALAVLQQPRAQHVPLLPGFARDRLRLDLDPARTCFLPPWVHRLSDALLYPLPTTGMRVALVLDYLVQVPVTAYGFDFFRTADMHYFDEGPSRHRLGESHAPAFERVFAEEVMGTIGRHVRWG